MVVIDQDTTTSNQSSRSFKDETGLDELGKNQKL